MNLMKPLEIKFFKVKLNRNKILQTQKYFFVGSTVVQQNKNIGHTLCTYLL